MSNNGEAIVQLFAKVRQICEQVSLLLQTADEQMSKAGFKSEGNTAIDGISYAIYNGRQWIPTTAFRFYRHANYPRKLAFISVLFDSHTDRTYLLKEPYVTAGILDFGENDASLQGNYWYSRYFGFLLKDPQLNPDGNPISFDNAKLEKDLQGDFKNGAVFAVPLVSITNSDEIKLQIVNKLINLFKNTENKTQVQKR